MKLLPRKPLLASAGCALIAAASLALPACTDTAYRSGGTSTYSGNLYQRVGGSRYYHCHPNGVCHNARHSNYYWSGGSYRPRPPHAYIRPSPYSRPPNQYYRPPAPPPRPRPR